MSVINTLNPQLETITQLQVSTTIVRVCCRNFKRCAVLVASHEHDVMTSTAACSMPPDTNDCGGREQRWFFHAEVGECREFTYKGCIESANNFASKEACQSVCLAPLSGKCRVAVFHAPLSGKCRLAVCYVLPSCKCRLAVCYVPLRGKCR